jgi:hypothetical protein
VGQDLRRSDGRRRDARPIAPSRLAFPPPAGHMVMRLEGLADGN